MGILKLRPKYIQTHGIFQIKGGSTAQIGILVFLREKISGGGDMAYLVGTPLAWGSGGSLRKSTSSSEGDIQSAFRGFDNDRLTDGVD